VHARSRRLAGCGFIVGGIVYSSWLLGLVLPTGLSQHGAYTSELEAAGVPWGWLIRLCDVLAGVLLCLAALAAFAGVGGGLARADSANRSWWDRWGGVRLAYAAVAVIGACTAAAGTLVLDCASSTRACKQLESTTPQTWHDLAHHDLSTISGVAFAVALVACTIAAIWRPAFGVPSRWVGVLVVLAAATSIPAGTLAMPAGWRGLPQRANEAVESALFILLGLALLRTPRVLISEPILSDGAASAST